MDSVLYPRELADRILDPPAKKGKAWSVDQEKWRRARFYYRKLGYARRAFVATKRGVKRAEHEHRPLVHFVADDEVGEILVHEDEILFMDARAIKERAKHAAEERLKKRRRKRS